MYRVEGKIYQEKKWFSDSNIDLYQSFLPLFFLLGFWLPFKLCPLNLSPFFFYLLNFLPFSCSPFYIFHIDCNRPIFLPPTPGESIFQYTYFTRTYPQEKTKTAFDNICEELGIAARVAIPICRDGQVTFKK